jgi:hypothetical protein
MEVQFHGSRVAQGWANSLPRDSTVAYARRLYGWACAVGWCCLVLLSALTVWLAVLGRLHPPSLWGAWGIVLLSAIVAAACRVLLGRMSAVPGVTYTTALVPTLLALAFLISGVPWSHALAWGAVIVTTELLWWSGRLPQRRRWQPSTVAPNTGQLRQSGSFVQDGTQPVELVEESKRTMDGGWDVLWGRYRVSWDAGAQRAVLHVPICPPMAEIPQVELEVDGDNAVDGCTTQREVYGVRLELRLLQPAQHSGHCWVEMVARAPRRSSAQL